MTSIFYDDDTYCCMSCHDMYLDDMFPLFDYAFYHNADIMYTVLYIIVNIHFYVIKIKVCDDKIDFAAVNEILILFTKMNKMSCSHGNVLHLD